MILNMRDNEIREEGHKNGILETLVGLVKDKILDIKETARRANMTPEEFAKEAGLKL